MRAEAGHSASALDGERWRQTYLAVECQREVNEGDSSGDMQVDDVGQLEAPSQSTGIVVDFVNDTIEDVIELPTPRELTPGLVQPDRSCYDIHDSILPRHNDQMNQLVADHATTPTNSQNVDEILELSSLSLEAPPAEIQRESASTTVRGTRSTRRRRRSPIGVRLPDERCATVVSRPPRDKRLSAKARGDDGYVVFCDVLETLAHRSILALPH